jgi:hypothetical protein
MRMRQFCSRKGREASPFFDGSDQRALPNAMELLLINKNANEGADLLIANSAPSLAKATHKVHAASAGRSKCPQCRQLNRPPDAGSFARTGAPPHKRDS